MKSVNFFFHTGLKQNLFSNVKLFGSWDNSGKYSNTWASSGMTEIMNDDCSYSYTASISFDDNETGKLFEWGVRLDTAFENEVWAITAEVKDWKDTRHVRQFVLNVPDQKEEYYLTNLSFLGANIQKRISPNIVRFALWAPNARSVKLVLGDPSAGYIGNQGQGIIFSKAMQKISGGVWETIEDIQDVDNAVYMFEIENDAGEIKYRTDLYSRCQVGSGFVDPGGNAFTGNPLDLDGRVSCSYIMDTDEIENPLNSNTYVQVTDFWTDEFNPQKPLPEKLQDLVIYELHIGALGYGQNRPGNIEDAIALIPHLEELGVNAVEILPIQEYSGNVNWGYGTTHFCAIEFSSGGPDHLKAFVKACHQSGIAVIIDVVYNHYPAEAERAEWMYDSTSHETNIYFWYEGKISEHFYVNTNTNFPEGGYIDNESSGWAPAFHEEMVRKLFTSSAVSLIQDFHFDGFRVDQTTSIHAYAKLKKDGSPAEQARIFGAKFLREWIRTLRLVKPNIICIAEDHSEWPDMVKSYKEGGIGFDAVWFNKFYHHLIGDTNRHPNLIASAGSGGNHGLDMTFFGHILEETFPSKLTSHETHDERGNSHGDNWRSKPTILAAVQQTDPNQITGHLKFYAEARARFAAGMNLLSAGIPMFFMGEEIGAAKHYIHDSWLSNKEDILGAKNNTGKEIFKFYKDIIRLRLNKPALRSSNIQVLYTHNDNRVIVFKRWLGYQEILIFASLSNFPFRDGYSIHHSYIADALWKEIFNSDALEYGGAGVGNSSSAIQSSGGWFNAVIPANGFVIFERI